MPPRPCRSPARGDTYISPKAALSFGCDARLHSEGFASAAPCVCRRCRSSTRVRSRRTRSSTTIRPSRPNVPGPARSPGISSFDHGNFALDRVPRRHARRVVFAAQRAGWSDRHDDPERRAHPKTRGLELAGNWRALDALELSGSVTYAHSRIAENDNFPASVGRWQPRVPEWRATALAAWRPVERSELLRSARVTAASNSTSSTTPIRMAPRTPAPAASWSPICDCATNSARTGAPHSASTTSATSVTGRSTPIRAALSTPRSPRVSKARQWLSAPDDAAPADPPVADVPLLPDTIAAI